MSVEEICSEVCTAVKAVVDVPPLLPDIVKRLIDNEPVYENKVIMISGTLIGLASHRLLEYKGITFEQTLSEVKSAGEAAAKELVGEDETIQTQHNHK